VGPLGPRVVLHWQPERHAQAPVEEVRAGVSIDQHISTDAGSRSIASSEWNRRRWNAVLSTTLVLAYDVTSECDIVTRSVRVSNFPPISRSIDIAILSIHRGLGPLTAKGNHASRFQDGVPEGRQTWIDVTSSISYIIRLVVTLFECEW
jgi:hypothetical protein